VRAPAEEDGRARRARRWGLAVGKIARRRWGRAGPYVPWAIGLVVAILLDQLVYARLAITDPARLARLESYDLYRMLRAMGSLWPWLMVGAVFIAIDSGRGLKRSRRRPFPALRRGTFVLYAAALAGGAAELLKPIVGRLKPESAGGRFEFVSLGERISRWSDLGMASSHAAVAFGAAMALSYLMPRAAPVLLLGAVACAMTRIIAGAHFLSDVYVAILLAYAITRLLVLLDLRNNRGAEMPTT
jgi:membrane-associated phospholipid phosphatase